MTKALTIATIFISLSIHAQVTERDTLKNIKLITVIDSIKWTDIAEGFAISNGIYGYHIKLDSNNRFKKIDFSCMARFTVDSGSWTINNHNTFVLKSKKQTLCFDIIKFDNFYFYLLPEQKQIFLKDLQDALELYKNFKGTFIGDQQLTAKDLVGYLLMECYYGRDVVDVTGT
jgi:hypothetical protein